MSWHTHQRWFFDYTLPPGPELEKPILVVYVVTPLADFSEAPPLGVLVYDPRRKRQTGGTDVPSTNEGAADRAAAERP